MLCTCRTTDVNSLFHRLGHFVTEQESEIVLGELKVVVCGVLPYVFCASGIVVLDDSGLTSLIASLALIVLIHTIASVRTVEGEL